MEHRYRALRVISFLYKLAAGLILAGMILGIVIALVSGVATRYLGDYSGSIAFFAAIGGGITAFLMGISLYGFAQLIDLLINTEENTRATAEYSRASAQANAQMVKLMQRMIQEQMSTRKVAAPSLPAAPAVDRIDKPA